MSDFYKLDTYASSEKNAEEIATAIISANLTLSCHITPLLSMYKWEGEVYNGYEWRIDVLLPEDKIDSVVELINEKHSYKLPACTWYKLEMDDATRAWASSELAL